MKESVRFDRFSARTGSNSAGEDLESMKLRIHGRLVSELDPSKMASEDEGEVREVVQEAINVLLDEEEGAARLNLKQRQIMVNELLDEVLGFGPLQSLLDDPTVSEIMVNAADDVYVERNGLLEKTNKTFRDDAHVMQVVERIIAPLGRRLDEGSPMVDARVPGGYRLNAIIPPLSLRGPTVTIRKFFQERYWMDDLVRIGTLTQEVADLLKICVEARLNMVISGGTGTGKTTLLNTLSAFIPASQRIVTIENPAELQLRQPHVVRLETRPPSIEGKNEVAQRELVINALRMRPDRIIVGESRSGEAFDMLQAMNTGHEGSMTTVHANAPRDALSRIENMVMLAGFDLPVKVIREMVASALDLIVQISRFSDGTRRVTNVTEVAGMEGMTITTQDIYTFVQRGVDRDGKVIGALESTGIRPYFTEKLASLGLYLPPGLFVRAGL